MQWDILNNLSVCVDNELLQVKAKQNNSLNRELEHYLWEDKYIGKQELQVGQLLYEWVR